MKVLMSELLPKAAPSCHAATVLRTGNDLLAAWFAGTAEGDDDVKIYLSRRSEDTWSTPEIVSQTPGPNWNPVLFMARNGDIVLYYKTGRPISDWRTMYRISADGGYHFSAVRELVPGDVGGRGPVRNKPVYLKSGRLLMPASLEKDYWRAFADVSDDDGKSAIPSNEIAIPNLREKGRGVIQPTIWESGAGVHMLLRSSEGVLYRSDSSDDGKTWCDAYPTDIPNNNSGIDLVALGNGRLMMVHNPIGKNWGDRTPLTLSESTDNGQSFHPVVHLVEGAGEYSYPAIILDDNTLHVVHTWKREHIMYHKISTDSAIDP